MSEDGYRKALGYNVPEGTIPCWVISDEDRFNAIQKGKPFMDYSPSCYFKIAKRIDNEYVEGYLGHSTYKGRFHDSLSSSYTYFQDYQKRKPVYFSFDQVSLYRLVEIIGDSPLRLILRRVATHALVKENEAFMIMPFNNQVLEPFFENHVRKYLKDTMNITVYRANDFSGNDIIIDTIYKMIRECELVIADTTYCNKNAFYEIGYASALEKEIITIQNTSEEQSLFFDRAHIRSIMYSIDKVEQFKEELKNAILAIRNKKH